MYLKAGLIIQVWANKRDGYHLQTSRISVNSGAHKVIFLDYYLKYPYDRVTLRKNPP